MPAQSSNLSTVKKATGATKAITAPSGGTWWCYGNYSFEDNKGENEGGSRNQSYSGGATIASGYKLYTNNIMCIRTA